MFKQPDTFKIANRPTIDPGMDLLYQKEQAIAGSIEYSIKRYYAHQPVSTEDAGIMAYHYHSDEPQKNYLELRYCCTGNRYCEEKSCEKCSELPTNNFKGKVYTADLFTFHFTNTFLNQFTSM